MTGCCHQKLGTHDGGPLTSAGTGVEAAVSPVQLRHYPLASDLATLRLPGRS